MCAPYPPYVARAIPATVDEARDRLKQVRTSLVNAYGDRIDDYTSADLIALEGERQALVAAINRLEGRL